MATVMTNRIKFYFSRKYKVFIRMWVDNGLVKTCADPYNGFYNTRQIFTLLGAVADPEGV